MFLRPPLFSKRGSVTVGADLLSVYTESEYTSASPGIGKWTGQSLLFLRSAADDREQWDGLTEELCQQWADFIVKSTVRQFVRFVWCSVLFIGDAEINRPR